MAMQQNAAYEFDATCLGAYGLTATWRRAKKELTRYAPSILVSTVSAADENVFVPGQDITISGVEALLALRAAIDQALLYDFTQPQPIGGVQPEVFPYDPQRHGGVGQL